MKKYILATIILSVACVSLPAQDILKKVSNQERAGDEIIKQQVEYKEPGRVDKNVLWDFSRLKSVNDSYTVVYSSPVAVGDSVYIMGLDTISVKTKDKFLIGTEHNTTYYYLISDSCTWLMGHENSASILKYDKPIPFMHYPLGYGDSRRHSYTAKGVYSHIEPFFTYGTVDNFYDAFGMMIIPGGDTLKNVFRIKTVQVINTVTKNSMTNRSIADNSKAKNDADKNSKEDSKTANSLAESSRLTESHNVGSVVETYRWYIKGYRYPVFETIQREGEFKTAFFYSPLKQDNIYDAENEAIRREKQPEVRTTSQEAFRYNMYPNPVSTNLNIEVYLPKQTGLTIRINDPSGFVLINEDKGSLTEGIHSFQLDVSKLNRGTYVLAIHLDDYVTSQIIMKN